MCRACSISGSMMGRRMCGVILHRGLLVELCVVRGIGMLGANITLVAPPTLLPLHIGHWPVKVSNDLDAVLASTDVLYMLRLQSERMAQGLVPSLHEYSTRYGLDEKRVAALQASAVVMHPGPMNRGVEMLIDPSDIPNSLIHRQVTNGVSVRMAVLFDLLSAEELS